MVKSQDISRCSLVINTKVNELGEKKNYLSYRNNERALVETFISKLVSKFIMWTRFR